MSQVLLPLVQSAQVNVLRVLSRQPTHPCAYLSGRQACDRGFAVGRLTPEAWHEFLLQGYRRAGGMIYQPACPLCAQCVPLRIPVGSFRPSRSQRRVMKRNADVRVDVMPVSTDAEHADLYHRYVNSRHNGMMSGSARELAQFLGVSPVDTVEIQYRMEGKLIGVGVTDRTPGGWSAVYCYFDPDMARRSLGTLNVLTTLRLCGEQCPAGRGANVYLGYWVRGSESMDYKSLFRPHEILEWGAGVWRPVA